MPLSLYRKYRPIDFADFIGQEHIIKTLTNAIEGDLISHAYLFCGPRGSGKTTVARVFAKAINCENRKGYEPCNKCPACASINQGQAIDIIEIDAASNRGIEEVRQLKEGAKFVPTRLKFKVFIVDEAHQLSRDAANALLKILEEPPSHVIFILATTEIHKMISTIISRCQRFDFHRITANEILKKLQRISEKEKIKIDGNALELISANAEGDFRNAESLLEQVITYAKTVQGKTINAEQVKDILGLVDFNLVADFFDIIIKKDPALAIDFLNKNIEKGLNPFEFGNALVNYLRSSLILKIDTSLETVAVESLTKEAKEKLKNQIKIISERDLRRSLKAFLDAQSKMKYALIPQLPIELAILEIIEE